MNCGNLTDPANGSVTHISGTTFGQTATYSCNTGYNLVENSTRTCQATGVWSGSAPICQGSLVLRPSHHPVFDCLYSMKKKIERKGLEGSIYQISDVIV